MPRSGKIARASSRDLPTVLVGHDGRHGLRLRRATASDFTEPRQRIFLAALRDTCNVAAAARVAGIQRATARRHRARVGGFAAAWEVAMADRLVGLKAGLTAYCLRMLAPLDEIDDEPGPRPPLDLSIAMRTLKLHLPGGRTSRGAPVR